MSLKNMTSFYLYYTIMPNMKYYATNHAEFKIRTKRLFKLWFKLFSPWSEHTTPVLLSEQVLGGWIDSRKFFLVKKNFEKRSLEEIRQNHGRKETITRILLVVLLLNKRTLKYYDTE